MRAAVVACLALAVGAKELTKETWDEAVSGKTVFVKFLAPWPLGRHLGPCDESTETSLNLYAYLEVRPLQEDEARGLAPGSKRCPSDSFPRIGTS